MTDYDFQLNETQLEQLRNSFDQNNLTVVDLKNGPLFIEDFQSFSSHPDEDAETIAVLEVYVSSTTGITVTLSTQRGHTDRPVDNFEHLISEIDRIRTEIKCDLI